MSDFQESLDALCAAIPRLGDILMEIGFDKWSRAHCPGKRYHYMTSNSAESMNSLSKHPQKTPITQLIDFFRQSVKKWFYGRRNEGIQGKHLLTEWTHKRIQAKVDNSHSWMVAGIGLNSFNVEDGRKRGLVDFSNGTCSCRVLQVSGLPCGHVIAVSRFLGEPDCGHYAMSCYSNEVYKSTYEEQINSIPHKSDCEVPDGLVDMQPPHITKRQAGRPKKINESYRKERNPLPHTAVSAERMGILMLVV
ncbi:uncharacterized protein LOC110900546 [Helianthus annuus]|uniref:uncharacterized protein LOC110900546 n=1 Tax=Helianthus annuus TaxID=4232 RepID=UPI000B8F89EF|nr:uncharacterized protein LOC110900546 [Helianthus annuus]